MNLHTNRDRLVLLIFGLALVGLFLFEEWRLTGGITGFPLDDSWIHYRFAENLRAGQGFSFNPGEPTPGSTAPLWVLLVALAGGGFVIPAKALGILAYLGNGLLVYQLGLAAGLRRRAALLAGLSALGAGRLVWAAPSGMETTAFSLFCLLGLWLWSRRSDRKLPVTASLVFGAACLLRPEGYLLVLLIALCALLRSWRDALRHLLLAGLAAAPYPLFSWLTTGHWLPNTFYAKQDVGNPALWGAALFNLGAFFFDNPVLLVLAIAGATGLMWRGLRLVWLNRIRPSGVASQFASRLLRRERRRSTALPPLNDTGVDSIPSPLVPIPWLLAGGLWLAALPALSSLVTPRLSFHVLRYTAPLVPLLALYGTLSAQSLFSSSHSRGIGGEKKSDSWLTLSLVASLAAALAVTGFFWAPLYARSVADTQALQVQVARWAAEHTPPGSILAANDVGAIGSLSGRKVIDLMGLTNPEVLPQIGARGPGTWDAPLARYIAEKKPDYLILFPTWFPYMLQQLPVQAVFRARLEPRSIAGIPNLTVSGGGELVVYRLDW